MDKLDADRAGGAHDCDHGGGARGHGFGWVHVWALGVHGSGPLRCLAEERDPAEKQKPRPVRRGFVAWLALRCLSPCRTHPRRSGGLCGHGFGHHLCHRDPFSNPGRTAQPLRMIRRALPKPNGMRPEPIGPERILF
ncbi:hypothetical protein AIOL_001416 [Candidatus Rhodobacter oscarellae]|uniref:Uncharacterized protein n=1 Tax=Candidatus Rhodobacter oscarellae TaxID=1675527 RepID=A0A0J9E199_9RHOB|nr:hypothetical protein AIOL_001416 [Candidatus Rhodobacter lobularis]